MGTFMETLAKGEEGALHLGPERARVYSDLSPEDKDRFVTSVKPNRGLKESNYDQLYAYLRQHEAHANENKMMLERFTQHTVDLLALISNVSPQQVVVQNVQGRQNRGQGNNARRTGAADNGGAQNRVGNVNPGQARQIKCYHCNGIGHIARNCTQPKQPQNSEYFKDKMLLMQSQENRVVLDNEQLLFIAGGQDNAVNEDVDELSVQDLALNVDNVFQANECDAFNSDVDEAPTVQTMFMENLSSADPIYDEAGPSYDSDILSKYVKDNAEPVVQNNVSSVPNDAYMMIINEMHKQTAQCVSMKAHTKVVDVSLIAELVTYKEQVEL
nr:retrovirus-related Pol polyprotein from transposon TNT 1-94 [Tanacetum cinerariifolium]